MFNVQSVFWLCSENEKLSAGHVTLTNLILPPWNDPVNVHLNCFYQMTGWQESSSHASEHHLVYSCVQFCCFVFLKAVINDCNVSFFTAEKEHEEQTQWQF